MGAAGHLDTFGGVFRNGEPCPMVTNTMGHRMWIAFWPLHIGPLIGNSEAYMGLQWMGHSPCRGKLPSGHATCVARRLARSSHAIGIYIDGTGGEEMRSLVTAVQRRTSGCGTCSGTSRLAASLCARVHGDAADRCRARRCCAVFRVATERQRRGKAPCRRADSHQNPPVGDVRPVEGMVCGHISPHCQWRRVSSAVARHPPSCQYTNKCDDTAVVNSQPSEAGSTTCCTGAHPSPFVFARSYW